MRIEKDEQIVLERSYVVPLRKAWNSSYHKRTKRAVRILREFASKHMKVDKENTYIDPYLNRLLWSRGNANPPRKIRVIMRKTSKDRVLIYDYENYLKTSQTEKEKEVEEKATSSILDKEETKEKEIQESKDSQKEKDEKSQAEKEENNIEEEKNTNKKTEDQEEEKPSH